MFEENLNELAVSGEAAQPPIFYDAAARNRFEYEVRHNGQKYDVAHIFGPLSDERYMQWNRDLRVRGNQDDISEESREASAKLWDELIVEVEGIEYEPETEWKLYIPSGEKLAALNDFLAVAIVEPEEKQKSKLRVGPTESTQTVKTECFFNGEVISQIHVLTATTFELEKKYERILAKRLKQERITGLRNRKPKLEYIPQDDKLGGLYDEMMQNTAGFANDNVPLRFKVAVINYIFASTLDQKNLGK